LNSLTPLTVLQANDVAVNLAVLEEDGVTAQNCTGLTPVMVIKAGRWAGDTDPGTVELTTATGLAWTAQTAGTLTATLTHALLATPGRLWWRLDLLDGNTPAGRTTAMSGPFTITPC
jgi:hypothetical protein